MTPRDVLATSTATCVSGARVLIVTIGIARASQRDYADPVALVATLIGLASCRSKLAASIDAAFAPVAEQAVVAVAVRRAAGRKHTATVDAVVART